MLKSLEFRVNDILFAALFIENVQQITHVVGKFVVTEERQGRQAELERVLTSHPAESVEVHNSENRRSLYQSFISVVPAMVNLTSFSLKNLGPARTLSSEDLRSLFSDSNNLKEIVLAWHELNSEDNHAIADGLMDPTLRVLRLEDCELQSEGSELICQRLATNTTVTGLELPCPDDARFYRALAEAVRTNNVLVRLAILKWGESDVHTTGLREVIVGLQSNTTLESFELGYHDWDDDASSAMHDYLRMTATLRRFASGNLYGEQWRRISSALETNSSLIILHIGCFYLTPEEVGDGMRALKNNSSLEDLVVDCQEEKGPGIIVAVINNLSGCTGLKTLYIARGGHNTEPTLSIEQGRSVIRSLRTNYTLSNCPFTIAASDGEDSNNENSDSRLVKRECMALLKLNGLGRSYLLETTPKKETGVELLQKVSDDLDCIYLHLRENPGLCRLQEEVSPDSSPDSGESRKRKAGELVSKLNSAESLAYH